MARFEILSINFLDMVLQNSYGHAALCLDITITSSLTLEMDGALEHGVCVFQ